MLIALQMSFAGSEVTFSIKGNYFPLIIIIIVVIIIIIIIIMHVSLLF